jgi:hypothetical protein
MTEARNDSTGERERLVPMESRAALLQLNLRRREAGVSEAIAVAEDELDARGRLLSNLITKILKLMKAESALASLLFATDDPVEYDDIALLLADVRAELALCHTRYDAIDAGRPFRDPGPAAEDSLLAAIRAVGAALANTAAVGNLLAAVHGLVQAYSAAST